ncbi:hypothetical protein CTI12_AA486700 [Artemisia annua]|uniref:Uncharacterized protein n=1 Tax=Artemisia annua TaxID=35608 RepID=A0A2U1LIS5_ARTAN|nr:hypothetical protein CTI12_AA486700 [Artemisia annua]
MGNRSYSQQVHHHPNTINTTKTSKNFFLPTFCGLSIKDDIVKPTKLTDLSSSSVSSSPDPSSPKISCIGQIKKRSNTTSNTNKYQCTNTSKSTTNIIYTKLLKLFSSKSLICAPVDNATISNDGGRSISSRNKRFNRSVTIPISSNKKHTISIEELDPPLPVVKLKSQDQEMNVNLGKRRGIELKTLQIQPIQLSNVFINNSKSLAQQQDRSAR